MNTPGAAQSVGGIKVDIGLDTSDLRKELAKLQASFDALYKELRKSSSGAGVSVGGAAAAGVAGGAIASGIARTSQTIGTAIGRSTSTVLKDGVRKAIKKGIQSGLSKTAAADAAMQQAVAASKLASARKKDPAAAEAAMQQAVAASKLASARKKELATKITKPGIGASDTLDQGPKITMGGIWKASRNRLPPELQGPLEAKLRKALGKAWGGNTRILTKQEETAMKGVMTNLRQGMYGAWRSVELFGQGIQALSRVLFRYAVLPLMLLGGISIKAFFSFRSMWFILGDLKRSFKSLTRTLGTAINEFLGLTKIITKLTQKIKQLDAWFKSSGEVQRSTLGWWIAIGVSLVVLLGVVGKAVMVIANLARAGSMLLGAFPKIGAAWAGLKSLGLIGALGVALPLLLKGLIVIAAVLAFLALGFTRSGRSFTQDIFAVGTAFGYLLQALFNVTAGAMAVLSHFKINAGRLFSYWTSTDYAKDVLLFFETLFRIVYSWARLFLPKSIEKFLGLDSIDKVLERFAKEFRGPGLYYGEKMAVEDMWRLNPATLAASSKGSVEANSVFVQAARQQTEILLNIDQNVEQAAQALAPVPPVNIP